MHTTVFYDMTVIVHFSSENWDACDRLAWSRCYVIQ